MGRRPFVSVVIPTRDRRTFLQYCLQSLRLQSFADFEVIVSDNFLRRSSKRVFDQLADSRVSYVKPKLPLSMCDNWEHGCEFATGEYVTVLIDKTILRPSALELRLLTYRWRGSTKRRGLELRIVKSPFTYGSESRTQQRNNTLGYVHGDPNDSPSM